MAAREGRSRRGLYEALQPRIFGRSIATHRRGALPGAESEIDRGGRARLSPRCFRPGPGSQSAPGLAEGIWTYVPLHLAWTRRGRTYLDAGRRYVPGSYRRDRHGRGTLSAAAAPLHPGVALGDPGSRSKDPARPRNLERGCTHLAESAVGVPFSHPVPDCD